MTQERDRKNFRNIPKETRLSTGPLRIEFENILVLVHHGVITYQTLAKRLGHPDTPYTTMKGWVNELEKLGYLYRSKQKRPLIFSLTQPGIQYLKIHNAKFLEGGVEGLLSEREQEREGNSEKRSPLPDSLLRKLHMLEKTAPISESSIKVTHKRPKTDSVSFDLMRFRETIEEYMTNLPSDYPKNPILLIRPHNITYKFEILQMDRYLTNKCKNGKGSLSNPNWCFARGISPFKPNDKFRNSTPYQGYLYYNLMTYFIQVTTRHVIVRFPIVFTENALHTATRILQFVFFIKAELEELFSTETTKCFLGSGDHNAIGVCVTQEYGIQLTALSIICDQLGLSLEDAQKRVRIDTSNFVPEQEHPNSVFGEDDLIWHFADIVWQVLNQIGVRETYTELQSLKEETSTLKNRFSELDETISTKEIILNRINNQILVLADQKTLTNQHIKTNEGEINTIVKYLAQTTQALHGETISRITQTENLDERMSLLEQKLASLVFVNLPDQQQDILDFLRENKPRSENRGYTRNELAEERGIKLGSVNGSVVALRKKKLIHIEKVGGEKRGRILLNSAHLRNQMKNNQKDRHVKS